MLKSTAITRTGCCFIFNYIENAWELNKNISHRWLASILLNSASESFVFPLCRVYMMYENIVIACDCVVHGKTTRKRGEHLPHLATRSKREFHDGKQCDKMSALYNDDDAATAYVYQKKRIIRQVHSFRENIMYTHGVVNVTWARTSNRFDANGAVKKDTEKTGPILFFFFFCITSTVLEPVVVAYSVGYYI